ncbi:helix-turn-helix domain-containing protein [Halobaculum sp. EA56]|uniref:helix-turn-helix domain-containing protein n=1 Tax=Halobaculum sp. EA56 TaxID=3421648 RepID=UPI003EB8EEA4
MSIESAEARPRTVELELLVRDPDCFFVAASESIGCTVELEDMAHRSDDRLLEFFTVSGTAPERVLDLVADAPAIDEAHLVRETDDGGLFEFVVAGPCVTKTLADAGAVTRSVTASNGEGRVVAEVPSHVTIRRVVERFTERHPGSELLAHRQRDRCLRVGHSEAGPLDELTQRQEEALRTAYASGYFNWPRDNGAEDCAAALGISQPTFSQHLRAGQRRLFEALFGAATDR